MFTMDDRMEIFKLAQSYKIKWELLLESKVHEVLCAHAQSLGCELDLLILPVFVSVASAMGSRAKVKVTKSWTECVNLTAIVAARRGERKSTVLNCVKTCSRQVKNFTDDKEMEGKSQVTVINESFVDNITETCRVRGSRLFVIDDLDIVLKKVIQMPDIWNLRTLQTSLTSCSEQNGGPSSTSINVIAAAQAANISEIINFPDPGRLLDRILVLCARDFEDIVISIKPSETLDTILQKIHDLHVNKDVSYTFSEEATLEFERMSGIINSIKKQCHNDELKRGCANHVMSQMARLSAISTALTAAVTDTNTDFTITKTTVQSMFVVSLYLLRQKCLLLHGSDSATYSELFHSILSSEVELLTTMNTSNAFSGRENEDDVIEITLDGNNEPVARIIPKRDDSGETSDVETIQQSDVTMWTMENRDNTISQNERETSSVYYPSVPQEVVGHPKQQRIINPPLNQETSNRQHYEQNQVLPLDGDSKQFNNSGILRPRGKFRPPPPPLKLRPHQLHVNRRFIPAPKRLTDKTQLKTCVFTCSDSIFVQLCCAKIRKCLLTKGIFITSSYACQYRLFPPVPLVQRTSSPRTTHPSWAAVKFFERLESLGFGEVTVFRSQSVKFRKKSLEEMSEKARAILRQVGITDEEYRSSLTTEEEVQGSIQEYNYIFTVHQNGEIETEQIQQMDVEQKVQQQTQLEHQSIKHSRRWIQGFQYREGFGRSDNFPRFIASPLFACVLVQMSEILHNDSKKTEHEQNPSRSQSQSSTNNVFPTGPIKLNSDVKPFIERDEHIYCFRNAKRGYAILIMNYEFVNEDENLPGVKRDIENMSKLFNSMGFEVREFVNLTNIQLITELVEIQNEMPSDCDCFVCVISTHGGEDPGFYIRYPEESYTKTEHYLLNTEGAIWTRQIVDMFNNQQCKALKGKPKLFFIQACRGRNVDKGVDLLENNDDESDDDSVNNEVFQIPCYNDSLVMFSSTSGKYAWSEDLEGGWLLSALQKVFSNNTGEDLLSLLTQVCGEVATREAYIPCNKRAHRTKSTACIYHKLSKDIYFPPFKFKK
ncbi:uncharacterized protein LOC133205025 [Saccostrea echinata]|uniref:uncharacterized protein LOC133205025 n=1 Tax=Saccostrea echinata TaxID=191078 RepID=UPI002A809DCB|nr:uncharacterized protein LOC133205025 [Saccostrea echinata]